MIVIDGNSISRGSVAARVGGTLNVTHILKIDACVLYLVFKLSHRFLISFSLNRIPVGFATNYSCSSDGSITLWLADVPGS